MSGMTEDISFGTDGDKKDDVRVSDNQMLVNLITTGLGAGILSMPWGVAGASIVTAAAVNGFVLTLNYFTIMLIIFEADRRQAFDIGSLLKQIPGRVGTVAMYITNSLVWFTMILCLISYLIVVYDSLAPLLPTEGIAGQRWFVLTMAMVFILPCCFLDQKYLSFTSVLSVVMNIYILFVVVYELATKGPADSYCWLGFKKGSISFFGAMMFTMVIQMCVVPMYEVMENRNPKRFGKIMGQAFVFLFLLFSAFGTLAYITYGGTVGSDILINLPNNIMGNIGRLGMLGVVLGVFPLVFVPIIAPVMEWQNNRNRNSYDGDGPYEEILDGKETRNMNDGYCVKLIYKLLRPVNFVSLAICVCVTIIAINVTKLGTMIVINGAISELGFVGLIPCVIGLNLHPNKDKFGWKVMMFGLLLFTATMTSLGLAFQNNYHEELHDHCLVQHITQHPSHNATSLP